MAAPEQPVAGEPRRGLWHASPGSAG
jgi:hypothetical protein